MKIYIDFTVFASPTEAYSNVSGELDWPDLPRVGDWVDVRADKPAPQEMPPTLRVTGVLAETPEYALIVMLDGVVTSSRSQAATVGQFCVENLGLYCDVYDEEG
jgi:hypothetical protein